MRLCRHEMRLRVELNTVCPVKIYTFIYCVTKVIWCEPLSYYGFYCGRLRAHPDSCSMSWHVHYPCMHAMKENETVLVLHVITSYLRLVTYKSRENRMKLNERDEKPLNRFNSILWVSFFYDGLELNFFSGCSFMFMFSKLQWPYFAVLYIVSVKWHSKPKMFPPNKSGQYCRKNDPKRNMAN